MATLGDIDLEGLSEPFEGEAPAGKWLRFDPIFDEVKRARASEANYLPQGIWERDTKSSNWTLSCDKSLEVLNLKSKDLQFAAWLTEALSHLYGIEGAIKGIALIDKMTNKLWDQLFPSLDEEDEFTPRLLIIEWLDRTLPSAIDMINVTATDTDLVSNICLREWLDIKRRPETEEARLEEFRVAVTRTPGEYLGELGTQINRLEETLDQTVETYSKVCGEGSVRFPQINSKLKAATRCLYEAEQIQAETLANAEEVSQEYGSTHEAGIVDASGVGGEIGSLTDKRPFDLLAECEKVTDRDLAYNILEILADRLVEIDPHSAAPYLAKKAASFKEFTFAELMLELVDDERMRKHLFKLMGIAEGGREGK